VRTLLTMLAALAFVYLVGFALVLLLSHRGGWMIVLGLVAVLAVGLTAWLIRERRGA
jgi:hypothetical protein